MKGKKMTRLLSRLLVFVMLLGMMPMARAQAADYLFEDDFSGDLSKWASVVGSFSVSNGQAVSAGSVQYSPADQGMVTVGDLEINVELKPVTSWAGIQFNMASTGSKNWQKTGYMLYIRSTGTADLLKGGPQTMLASNIAVPGFSADTLTKVKVVYTAASGNIKVYFNGSAEASMDLTDTQHIGGYFGLVSDAKNSVFDNFTVQGTKNEAAVIKHDLTTAAVTVDSTLGAHASSYINDGSVPNNTSWISTQKKGSADVNHWAQLALTEAVSLNKVILYPRVQADNNYYYFPVDFTIQVSADGQNWATVVKETGYTVVGDGSDLTYPQTFTFTEQSNVKYIKIDSTKNSGAINYYALALAEVEAYNDPAVEAAEEVLLTGATVTADSQHNADFAPAKAIDGSVGTGWLSARTAEADTHWLQVELKEAAALNQIVLVPRNNEGAFLYFPEDFTVQVSPDGASWVTVAAESGYRATDAEGEAFAFATQNVKFIKVQATKNGYETYKGTNYYGFQLMELKAYNRLSVTQALAESITALAVDYDQRAVVLPQYAGITVEIASTSDPNAVALNGAVDLTNGGSSDVVLKLTDAAGLSALTAPIKVEVVPLLEQLVVTQVTASSAHDTHPAKHLIDGDLNNIWSNAQDETKDAELIFALQDAAKASRVVLYPRNMATSVNFPETFRVYLSADGENWGDAVYSVENYTLAENAPVGITLSNAASGMKFVKLAIAPGSNQYGYVHLAEVELWGLRDGLSAEKIANELTVSEPKYGDETITFGNVGELFRAEIIGAEPAGIIAADGTVTYPETDTEVTLTIKVTGRLDGEDVAETTRKVMVKCIPQLQVEALAEDVDLIPCPGNTDTEITLPTVPDGYTIEIAESDHPAVVATDGTITRSDDTTYGVRLTLKITDTATNASAETASLLVPIYKTFVAPTMTQEEIDVIREDYEDNAYGVFVHYISMYRGNASVYADGEKLMDVDEAAEAFDAEAFAKSIHEVGAEYVVLTLWHGDTRPLFPSMTNQRWRDERRGEDTLGAKTYSDADIITPLIPELKKYGIDLFLYTHPCDGHDFTVEDQTLTGWNDPTNDYATWHQYINELYYEVCERWGSDIKGLWFDGQYKYHDQGGVQYSYESQARLKETCKIFNPAMILTANLAFREGTVYETPRFNAADYFCWEINEYNDFNNDRHFARHQAATVLANKGWWTTVANTETFDYETAEEMFRYMVAMSSVSTEGGWLASTGFYPSRKDENGNFIKLDDYFMPGIGEQLRKMNTDYLQPVKESIQDTNDSTAYLTPENSTISQLEWGVANESKDGKNVYLHVLNAPEGNTLTLPATADGTELSSDAVIMNFDGTTTPITVEKTADGYSITLPEGTSWNEVDTIIKAERFFGDVEGDLDESGKVDTADVVLLLQQINSGSADPERADINGDGKVTLADALRLLKQISA